MKSQLSDIEKEKSKISEKISELTNSLSETNLIKSPFKEKNIKKISPYIRNSDTNLDISTKVKNIFSDKS